MTPEQRKWLASYEPSTWALSTYAAKDCGYGDLLREGYVVNRGTDTMPDLYITSPGILALKSGLQ